MLVAVKCEREEEKPAPERQDRQFKSTQQRDAERRVFNSIKNVILRQFLGTFDSNEFCGRCIGLGHRCCRIPQLLLCVPGEKVDARQRCGSQYAVGDSRRNVYEEKVHDRRHYRQ